MNKEIVCRTAEIVVPSALMVLGTVWAFNDGVRRRVREEQGGKCADCGQKGSLQVHHKVPQCLGGADTRANAVGLCKKDHLYWDVSTIRDGIMYGDQPIENADLDLIDDRRKFRKGVMQIRNRTNS